MGIFGKLFGTPKATEALVESARNAGDKLFFTSEEKDDSRAKMREWFLEYLKVTQPQTLARRFIAIVVTMLWTALCALCVVGYFISENFSSHVFMILEKVTIPFGGIMAFYFVTSLTRAAKGDEG